MQIRRYQDSDFEGVDRLWREAFPDDPPRNQAAFAIPAKLAFQPDFFFVACPDDTIAGTVMAGYDGHRGWLYAVAVGEQHRRSGIGTALVRAAESALHGLGCNKINLQVRAGNEEVTAFYTRIGYAVEDRISLGRQI
ncbi:MAG: GNAT family acetyltransferase [Alphaproteobacteria bacterium HGW-Alphaproteobacteria-7]|jgi:ribosomal protein S18 acetylase RimI-like enzyme|nr:MAG: GNAT family acetyltransferase [Alphaproteobacteria bacterium HGW-Alphaproteobacteria-7]